MAGFFSYAWKERLVTYAIYHQIAGGQGYHRKTQIFIEYVILIYHLYLYTRGPIHKFVHNWSPSAWPAIGSVSPSPDRANQGGQQEGAGRKDRGRLAAVGEGQSGMAIGGQGPQEIGQPPRLAVGVY